jgi:hypothetical protein
MLVSALGLLGGADACSVLADPFQCFSTICVFTAISAVAIQGEIWCTLVKSHIDSYTGTRWNIDPENIRVVTAQNTTVG